MSSSQLKWKKFAGYVLPILWGWFLIVWTVGVSLWILDSRYYAKTNWLVVPIAIWWLALVPVMGHTMGIVNAYCWKNISYDEGKIKESLVLLSVFWLLSFPVTLSLIISMVGIVVFPIHMVCFWGGQERGKRWIKSHTIDRFLGRKNEWERDEPE